MSIQETAASLGVYFTSTRPERSARKASQGAPFTDPWFHFPGDPCAAYPIGTLDIGMVDPFDVLKARTANQIPEPHALIHLTRTATDDEILGTYHDLPLLTLAVALVSAMPSPCG